MDNFRQAQLRKAACIVEKNWQNWAQVFGHRGDPRENPILLDPGVFSHFMWEYSVNRTVRAGTHDAFRLRLRRSCGAFQDDTGCGIDDLEERLRPHFGTHDGQHSLTSVLSKVAAFLRPNRFIAYDRYAQRGLNELLSLSGRCRCYSDYLAAADRVWAGPAGREMSAGMKVYGGDAGIPVGCFKRRMLDVCLMMKGGRWTRR